MDQTPISKETSTPMQAQSRGKRGFLTRFFLPDGLSGKLLMITALFIMLAEVLIFVPSVANYRLTWLKRQFTTGEVASLSLRELPDSQSSEALRMKLLDLTQTDLIVFERDGAREILARRDMPVSIDDQIMVTDPGRLQAIYSIRDALDTLIFGGDRTIRVYGPMAQSPGQLEMVMSDEPMREAMLGYARNVLLISLSLAFLTAGLVFLTLRSFLIRPLQSMTSRMLAFARDPQDGDLVIKPTGRRDEIGVAEEQLSAMQKQVRGQMNQQRRLADLGLAVSKINHDLRNILASASLFSDRLTSLEDPTVQRLAPRLVRTIDRAVDYTRSVLEYGKAGEGEPKRAILKLHRLMEEVAQVLSLDMESDVEWNNKVAPDLEIEADADQFFRVALNLCRNSVQVMTAMNDANVVRRLTVEANSRDSGVEILVSDTGPGFETDARDKLFSAFAKSTRAGGTGLGLAIAAELVWNHGGTIELLDNDMPGAQFRLWLPTASV
ncbi:ATP-binding protein [Pseudahrensia aquimaris]|uniref:histidine kinase n=1 Tax=Pseudahrensia aquimaris TaxID=744461 RepID=A0ABW3FIU1_9HYPH